MSAARSDLEALLLREEALQNESATLSEKILKRRRYLQATAELLRELKPEVYDTPASAPSYSISSVSSEVAVHIAAMREIPRDGYGAATKGVLAMLGADPTGCSARDMIDAVSTSGFAVQNPDIAVRSALKNLRKQGKVVYNEGSNKYELTALGRSRA